MDVLIGKHLTIQYNLNIILVHLDGGEIMPTTITCADLKNNYDDISRICHETKEPVYITKDG